MVLHWASSGIYSVAVQLPIVGGHLPQTTKKWLKLKELTCKSFLIAKKKKINVNGKKGRMQNYYNKNFVCKLVQLNTIRERKKKMNKESET